VKVVVLATRFVERYKQLREEKRSILSIGLDPALPGQRDKYHIPQARVGEPRETLLEFCFEVLEQVSDYCCAAKANTQYLLPLCEKDYQRLNHVVHKLGMVSILDHKLGDIGASNEAALYWVHRLGFDAITFSPFPGNLGETTRVAQQKGLGVLVLTLMSNPEAELFMRRAVVDGLPIYKQIARQVFEHGADGCVVGATGHVTTDEIRWIRRTIGEDRIILFPGVGAQGGRVEHILEAGGENILIHLGRAVLYAENPGGKAEEYYNWIMPRFRAKF